MPQYGTWVSYGGTARLLLAIILLAAAGRGLAYAGTRFRHPRPASLVRAAHAPVFMLLALVIALGALLACWTAYMRQELARAHRTKAPPARTPSRW